MSEILLPKFQNIKKLIFNGRHFKENEFGFLVPNKTVIVSSAAVGKTWLGEYYDYIYDLDPKNFSSDANFPFNYVDAALDKLSEHDICLMAFLLQKTRDTYFPHEFVKNKLNYIIALPKISGLNLIYERMYNRGDSVEKIQRFMYYYPIFIEKFGCLEDSIIIEDDEYLEHTLLRKNIINPDLPSFSLDI